MRDKDKTEEELIEEMLNIRRQASQLKISETELLKPLYLTATSDGIMEVENGELGEAVKGKILVMDDEEMIRDFVREALPYIGYEVEAASDGSEAIDLYKIASGNGKTFDAVIMDLNVPGGMGGVEATKKLLEINPGVRVIVSSGYSNGSVMSEYGKFGFRAVLPKPYKIDELSETVSKVIKAK